MKEVSDALLTLVVTRFLGSQRDRHRPSVDVLLVAPRTAVGCVPSHQGSDVATGPLTRVTPPPTGDTMTGPLPVVLVLSSGLSTKPL